MKQKIRVSFLNWFDGFDYRNIAVFSHEILKNNFDIIIDDEDPEIIFFGTYGDFISNACRYDNAIKILIITEPISPDFILFDYCLSFEPYDFGGRNCFYPDYIDQVNLDYVNPSFDEALSLYYNKNIFCDFIYSHETHNGLRKKYFDLLNEYRKVESSGTYLNNQKDNNVVNWDFGDKSKFEFQSNCRFSLCIQELDWEYFINEKLVHSLQANTIPLFYGTDKVKEIFNPERIVFLNDHSENELKSIIKEIDNNPKKFAEIVSKPMFNENFCPQKVLENAANFVANIFTNKEKRRNDLCKPLEIKKRLLSQKESYDKLQRIKRFWKIGRKK